MKKTIKQNKTIEVVAIEDIVCNKCGQSCSTGSFGTTNPLDKEYDGLIEAEVNGGYYSKRLGDMNRYVFSLCENCLIELFKTFTIDPFVEWWEGEGDYSEVVGE